MPPIDSLRANYEPQRGFVVRSPFYANGRHFRQGDVFSPRDADCDDRRLRSLWENRYIECCCSAEDLRAAKAAEKARAEIEAKAAAAEKALADAAAKAAEPPQDQPPAGTQA